MKKDLHIKVKKNNTNTRKKKKKKKKKKVTVGYREAIIKCGWLDESDIQW